MVAKVRPNYVARAQRSGRWWAIDVPELRSVFSQARRLDQVAEMARDAISLFLEIPPDSFDVTVEPVLRPDVRGVVDAAISARRELLGKQAEAASKSRKAVQKLAELGLPLRDIGAVLEISHQRVGQLAGRSQPTNGGPDERGVVPSR
jgi:predicted RNase H-like HicB family nuclease